MAECSVFTKIPLIRGDRMNLKTRSQVCLSLALLGAFASQPLPVYAQNQLTPLFANAGPLLRERMFMRLDYIRANVKTTSSDVQDVTGPVVRPKDFAYIAQKGTWLTTGPSGDVGKYRTTVQSLFDQGLRADVAMGYSCEAVGLGTPCGTRARAQSMIDTAAISLGYYLDDDHSWAVEAIVLGKPVDITVQGDGPSGLNGKDIIKLKMLPPIVSFNHYFGTRADRIRPYAGVLGSYAVFYDVRATSTLNDFVGGGNPGDTSVHINNTFGWGGMLGARAEVNDDWHVALSVGKIRFKTEATLVTRNTVLTGDSAVLNDFGPNIRNAIAGGDSTIAGGTTRIMCDLARARYGNTSCNQGEFVRKAPTVMDTTLFMLSLGRTF
jgi:outer membrane protein W